MNTLLNNILDRRLKLLVRLTYQDQPQSLEDLAQELNISKRILSNDIQIINKDWKLLEIKQKGKLVSIQYNNGSNIRNIYKLILNKEPIFRLINTLILNPTLDMTDLSKKAAMSEASIYRNIRVFNESFLRDFGVKISSTPFKLKGDQKDILLFSSVFLFDQLDMNEWPFSDYKKNDVEHFVSFFINSCRISLNFSEFKMTCLYVVLAMIWAKSLNLIESLSIDENSDNPFATKENKGRLNFLLMDDINSFLTEVSKYEKIFNFPINGNSLAFIFSIFFRNGYFILYQDFLDHTLKNSDINKSFFYLKRLLYDLETRYNIKPENRHNMLMKLHNILYSGYIEPNMTPFFNTVDRDFHHDLANEFRDLFATLQSKIEGYYHHMKRPVSYAFVNVALFSLFIKLSKLIYNEKNKISQPSVLIISSLGPVHGKLLKDIVLRESSIPMRIDVYDKTIFNEDELMKLKYDILWADFPIATNKNKCNILLYNIFPTRSDIKILKEKIKTLNTPTKEAQS